MSINDSLPTRGSLLARVKNLEDHQAWQEFCDTYRGLMMRLAFKAGLREDEAEEVVQEVFVSLARNIGEFVYDPSQCSFKHWLTQMVRWRIGDQYQKRLQAHLPMPEFPDRGNESYAGLLSPATATELDEIWDDEWRKHLISRATAQLKKRLKPKHFQIFFLNVLKDIPAAEVAQRLKVTIAQVYLVKLRASRLFQSCVKTLDQQSKDGFINGGY